MQRNQRGISMFGIVALLLAGGFVLVSATKLVPPYIEYFAIKKVLTAMKNSEDLTNMPVSKIQAAFDRRASIDQVTSVKGRDLEIVDEGGRKVVTAVWRKEIHIAGNFNVCLDFEESTDGL